MFFNIFKVTTPWGDVTSSFNAPQCENPVTEWDRREGLLNYLKTIQMINELIKIVYFYNDILFFIAKKKITQFYFILLSVGWLC